METFTNEGHQEVLADQQRVAKSEGVFESDKAKNEFVQRVFETREELGYFET